jgi:hypothetical protein
MGGVVKFDQRDILGCGAGLCSGLSIKWLMDCLNTDVSKDLSLFSEVKQAELLEGYLVAYDGTRKRINELQELAAYGPSNVTQFDTFVKKNCEGFETHQIYVAEKLLLRQVSPNLLKFLQEVGLGSTAELFCYYIGFYGRGGRDMRAASAC